MTAEDISPWNHDRDSISAVTALLHRAYAAHVVLGIEFGAAIQDEETTLSRIDTAAAKFVATIDEHLVGIISYYDHRRFDSEPQRYGRNGVAHFGQFAVEPELQGGGQRAAQDGKAELSCDTACDLRDLIEFYERLGYRDVGRHRWPLAEFESIVLSKGLRTQSSDS